jgi:general secretion pathway protein C
MGIDAVLKRYWVVVIGAMMALAAYFQASGVGELVGAAVTAGAPSTAPAKSKTAPRPIVSRPVSKSAAAILSRNPFDSITGPLDGSQPIAHEDLPPAAPVNTNDPYQDPPCSGVKASLITASDDPEWSFASLSSSDGKTMLRRKGDSVGGATVNHIGWFDNPPEPSPRVWLNEGGSRCLVGSGGEIAVKKPVAATPPPGEKTEEPKTTRQRVPADLDAKITKLSETSFQVERSAIDQIIQNYAKLAAGLRTRPTKEGMRLSGIRPNSLLSKLGMKNSDVLKTINGYDMGDQDKALEAYAKLRTSSKLSITVERGGAPTTIDIAIK